ncbi:MAG: hypothetical protein LAO79_23530 [Acidobacteriia bacterium]|nr:hypothetical protein [Terriglobia bacterium]
MFFLPRELGFDFHFHLDAAQRSLLSLFRLKVLTQDLLTSLVLKFSRTDSKRYQW